MEQVIPFQITIPKYKEVVQDNKMVTYYVVEVLKKGASKLTLDKRFREFDYLHNALKSSHADLPTLPGKSLFKVSTQSGLEKRRKELEEYLLELSKRTDIISSTPFKNFLQIESYAPEFTVKPSKVISEVDFVLGVRDFVYEIKEGVLFVALSDTKVVSRVESYVQNMKMPWSNNAPNQKGSVTVGAIECYLQRDQERTEFKFDRMWTKTFPTQIICMHWCKTSNFLLVGGDDGTLCILKVDIQGQFLKYEEAFNNKMHEGRIMGVYYDAESSLIYSIGEDKKFKVFDMTRNYVICDITASLSMLTCLSVDVENKRAFITNRNGQLYIYDISQKDPLLRHTFQAHSRGAAIRSCYYDSVKNYLFTACFDDGVITIHDLQKPGKEKFMASTASMQAKKEVRSINWSPYRYELFSGGSDGAVTFWDARKVSPIYVDKTHKDAVTKLVWIENRNLLISGGKDKRILFHNVPDEWRDKKLEQELLKEAKIYAQTEAMLEVKRNIQKKEEDSDDDDLKGWNK